MKARAIFHYESINHHDVLPNLLKKLENEIKK